MIRHCHAEHDGDSGVQMLAMVVARHWRLYGHYIEEVLPHTGANQMTLVGLIARLKVEDHHPC